MSVSLTYAALERHTFVGDPHGVHARYARARTWCTKGAYTTHSNCTQERTNCAGGVHTRFMQGAHEVHTRCARGAHEVHTSTHRVRAMNAQKARKVHSRRI